MKTRTRLLIFGALFLSLCGTASGDAVDGDSAIKLLTGSTWSGKNESGRKFWFYHTSDGKAFAKFEPGYGNKRLFTASWKMTAGGEICWEWEYGETNCYVLFEIEGNELSMTRRDGVVHSGRLKEGNTEGL
ncbi:MAG: hypothetical protein U5R46_19820 [Gammaproteobacteria bacterium]|nr:hypothetical protein [Gammaproteobacteria bacterium]